MAGKKDFLSIKEAALLAGISESTIIIAIKRGHLEENIEGRKYKIDAIKFFEVYKIAKIYDLDTGSIVKRL